MLPTLAIEILADDDRQNPAVLNVQPLGALYDLKTQKDGCHSQGHPAGNRELAREQYVEIRSEPPVTGTSLNFRKSAMGRPAQQHERTVRQWQKNLAEARGWAAQGSEYSLASKLLATKGSKSLLSTIWVAASVLMKPNLSQWYGSRFCQVSSYQALVGDRFTFEDSTTPCDSLLPRLKYSTQLMSHSEQRTAGTVVHVCYKHLSRFGGIPLKCIDNMTTVVDSSLTQIVKQVVWNKRFEHSISRAPVACWPYRPRQKARLRI